MTSVVAGNCGFSIAPCAPDQRRSMISTLVSVEDMRAESLQAGIDWSFETYGEYLANVSDRGTAINFGGYVGHTAVRLWVLGDDAYERVATPEEIAEMAAIVSEAMSAGALGFSSDRSPFHRGDGGRPVPSAVATHGRDRRALAGGRPRQRVDSRRAGRELRHGSTSWPRRSASRSPGRQSWPIRSVPLRRHPGPASSSAIAPGSPAAPGFTHR